MQGQSSIRSIVAIHSLTQNLTSFITFVSKTLYSKYIVSLSRENTAFIVKINMVTRNTIIKCTMYPHGSIICDTCTYLHSLCCKITIKHIKIHITCTST